MRENENEHLISKKDVLQKYKISYGSLYRWKRKGLIPEEWFSKKSTITGQETFFPKELICKRLELILEAKDDVLLDELAKKINGTEESNIAIVLMTIFGERKFFLKDIKEVQLIKETGDMIDITSEIINILKEVK